WSEGLRAELALHGVHVLVVCPGTIETEFRANLLEDRPIGRWRSRGMTADRCAVLTIAAMRARRNEIVVTWGAKALAWLNRFAPRLVDWLMTRYARRGLAEPDA